jgi:hypothetical protein
LILAWYGGKDSAARRENRYPLDGTLIRGSIKLSG